jgi:hypothetical protein
VEAYVGVVHTFSHFSHATWVLLIIFNQVGNGVINCVMVYNEVVTYGKACKDECPSTVCTV